jgi:tetraacyldisaccharide 4'-kinase
MANTLMTIKEYLFEKIGICNIIENNDPISFNKKILCHLVLSLLKPVSIIYGLIISIRNFIFDTGIFKIHKLDCMVISIGNITVGGTGKTPAVISLGQYFIENGKKVAILLRGYKGKENESRFINDPSNNAGFKDLSDEALMIANEIPKACIITGKDRIKSGLIAIDKFSPNVIILDDAFQHRRIHRDYDILIMDYAKPLGNGKLLPAGTLRESASNIKRGNAIIFSRVLDDFSIESLPSIIKRELTTSKKYSAANHILKDIIKLPDCQSINVEDLSNKKFLAFSGIAKPDSFSEILKRTRIHFDEHIIFDDHHQYVDSSYDRIIKRAKELKIDALITTEKDIVKIQIEHFKGFSLYYLKIGFEFKSGLPCWKELLT